MPCPVAGHPHTCICSLGKAAALAKATTQELRRRTGCSPHGGLHWKQRKPSTTEKRRDPPPREGFHVLENTAYDSEDTASSAAKPMHSSPDPKKSDQHGMQVVLKEMAEMKASMATMQATITSQQADLAAANHALTQQRGKQQQQSTYSAKVAVPQKATAAAVGAPPTPQTSPPT